MAENQQKKENLLVNLIFNIAIPSLVLSKLSDPDRFGPVGALLFALVFPIAYGVWDFVTSNRRINFFSSVGLASTLLTGGFGLLKLDGIWFASKEAATPLLFCIATLVSLRSKVPLLRLFVLNDQVFHMQRIEARLRERGSEGSFADLTRRATLSLAGSFLVSSVLNFMLAVWVLKSPAGSPEFNSELGRMMALSFPVIVLPSMAVMAIAVWQIVRGIRRLTGLTVEEMLRGGTTVPGAASQSGSGSSSPGIETNVLKERP